MSKNIRFLSKAQLRILIFYFPILLIISLALSVIFYLVPKDSYFLDKLFNISSLNNGLIITFALVGSLSMNICACSIFYIRKLYKLMISDLININNKETTKNLGTFIYFLFRPIFSSSFSILLVIGLNAGLISLSSTTPEFNSSIIDLTMFLSFFVGFSSGNFLNCIETKSKNIVKKLMDSDNE